MNEYQFKQFIKPNRHILAFASGIIGGSLPNTNSNISPIIIGSILAGFIVKMIYGDYDKGYIYTFSDIVFWTITLLEGAFSSYLFSIIK